MHRIRALALLAAVGVTALASSANAATVLTIGPDSLCGANGCFAGDKKAYTRTFSAGEGGGTVSALSLFRGLVGANANQAVRVTFQLADGTEVVWGAYRVGMMQGDQFVTIETFQGFNWEQGDLTVKLELVDLNASNGRGAGGSFWSVGGSAEGGGFGAGFGGSAGGASDPELPIGGVATTLPSVRPALPVQPIIAVPEPGAWALMILGFGAAGSMLRRRRAYHLKYS
jgi:hypothetical protein